MKEILKETQIGQSLYALVFLEIKKQRKRTHTHTKLSENPNFSRRVYTMFRNLIWGMPLSSKCDKFSNNAPCGPLLMGQPLELGENRKET